MSDTDFYRWIDSTGRTSQAYSSTRSAKGGITWDKKCDALYYHLNATYKIQKLTATLGWVDTPGFLPTDPWSKEPTATLEWVNIDGDY